MRVPTLMLMEQIEASRTTRLSKGSISFNSLNITLNYKLTPDTVTSGDAVPVGRRWFDLSRPRRRFIGPS